MVCPRCITSVNDIFASLKINIEAIDLGKVETSSELSPDAKTQLEQLLIEQGFELLQNHRSQLLGQIKSIIIQQIHHSQDPLKVNFSQLISEKLNQDYAGLSKLFSQVEGITIEKFILKQKVEKVKELIVYNELNFSEIAYQLQYSSVAHLSSQFKKETGMTLTAFKKLDQPNRNSLDTL